MRELQANILQSHGRKHAVLVFLRLQQGSSEGRRWLSEYARASVTSAADESLKKPAVLIHIAVSAEGYQRLGINPVLWPVPSERPDVPPGPDVFRAGLRHRSYHLGERPVEDWDPAFRKGVHLLIMIASNDLMDLIGAESRLLAGTRGVAAIVAIERALNIGSGAERTCDPQTGTPCQQLDFTPSDAMAQLLTPDPAGHRNESYGSYFVFRKLEHGLQNGVTQRFSMGPEASAAVSRGNCGSPDAPAVWQTIARRCLAYGGEVEMSDGKPAPRGHGLLFMCYQSNIREQFEAVHRWWSSRHQTAVNGTVSGSPAPAVACSGFSPYLTLRGGEYFFSPSMTFFRRLNGERVS